MTAGWWAAAAAGALAAEAMGRGLAAVTPEPLWWHDLFTQRKEEQLRRLRRGGGVDVVFCGSSKMLYGVDPEVVRERTGATGYNASIYRGVPRVTEAWLGDYVLPHLRPPTVVVGISPTEVSDNSPLTTRLAEYRNAKVFTMGRLQRAYRQASRVSYAVRYAPVVRRPRTLARHLTGMARDPRSLRWSHPHEIRGYLGPQGQGTDLENRSYRNGSRLRMLAHQQAGENYSNGGVQAGAYAGMARLADEHGARLVVATMPATDEFIDEVFQGGRAAWEAESGRLRGLVADLGLELVDVAGDFEDTRLYADLLHLNGHGRTAFSQRLATALIELPRGPLAVRRPEGVRHG